MVLNFAKSCWQLYYTHWILTIRLQFTILENNGGNNFLFYKEKFVRGCESKVDEP